MHRLDGWWVVACGGCGRALVRRRTQPAAERHLRRACPTCTLTPAAMVAAFTERFDLPCRDTPSADAADVPDRRVRLRVELVCEEAEEFADAASARDLVGIADALADLVYAAYGSALAFGIDLDPVIAAVHASNMTKHLRPAGQPSEPAGSARAEVGKLCKGPGYRPPDIPAVLAAQGRPAGRGQEAER